MSYNTNDDCKGNTGAVMTLGEGAIIIVSCKRKLNVKSSTEGELVGADDALGKVIRTKHFIEG